MSEVEVSQDIVDLIDYLDPNEELDHIELSTISMIGSMGSGKTTTAKTLAAAIESRRGEEFYAIYARQLVSVLDFLDNDKDLLRGVTRLFIILDDVASSASWQAVLKNMSNVYKYLVIRHELKKLGFEKGVVSISYLIQYVKLLAPVFRSNSGCILFKTGAFRDRTERKMLREMLRSDYYHFLRRMTVNIMVRHDDEWKSFSVASWIDGRNEVYELESPEEPVSIEDATVLEYNDEELLELVIKREWDEIPKRIKVLLLAQSAVLLYHMGFGYRQAKRLLRDLDLSFTDEVFSNIWKSVRTANPEPLVVA